MATQETQIEEIVVNEECGQIEHFGSFFSSFVSALAELVEKESGSQDPANYVPAGTIGAWTPEASAV